MEPVEPPGVVEDDLGDGTLDLPAEAASRVHRRMSIPQVRASMERVTGGITWTSGSTDLWEQYASTLGVPDFQERTIEDRSASVLFNKFLDDAASAACDEWVTGELASSFFTETTLEDTEPEPVRRNIAALRRRIQGRPFEPDSGRRGCLPRPLRARHDPHGQPHPGVGHGLHRAVHPPQLLCLLGEQTMHPTRRHLLAGLLGAGGLAALAGSLAASYARADSVTPTDPDRYFVFVYFFGGWDVLLCLDPRHPDEFKVEPRRDGHLAGLRPAVATARRHAHRVGGPHLRSVHR